MSKWGFRLKMLLKDIPSTQNFDAMTLGCMATLW